MYISRLFQYSLIIRHTQTIYKHTSPLLNADEHFSSY